MTDAFTVTNPVIDTVEPLAAATGDPDYYKGRFFGTKKGKVYLEYMDGTVTKKKKCKVTLWEMNTWEREQHDHIRRSKASGRYLPVVCYE